MPQNKVSPLKRGVKIHRKNFLSWSAKKKKRYEKEKKILVFVFPASYQIRNVFSETSFFFCMKWKNRTGTSSNPNRESHEKNCFETRRSMVRMGRFHIKLYMSIFIGENSSRLIQVFLNESLYVKLPKTFGLFCWDFTLIDAKYYRHV